METSVEYLYMSETDLDGQQTKCGEIFVCLSSFDCFIVCNFCKNPAKYSTFDDFADHVKQEHLVYEGTPQSVSPTGEFVEDIDKEGVLVDEKIDLDAAAEDDIKYTYPAKLEVELYSPAKLEEAYGYGPDLDRDLEMLLSDEDCTNDDADQSSDVSEVNIPTYRQCMAQILNMYRKCLCLWHMKTARTTSNGVKSAILKLLLKKYCTYCPDSSINNMLGRINIMTKRCITHYQKYDRNDDVEAKPWYFQHLEFLRYAECEVIPDKLLFQEFKCPWCKNKVAKPKCSIDLWNHITTNHLKVDEMDPLIIDQRRRILPLQWPQDEIFQFIDLFQKHECLWNTKSKKFCNRSLKAKAYETIVEKCSKINLSVIKDRGTIKDVVKKLRIFFCHTLRKHQRGEPLDENSQKYKIYEKLLFLQNVYMPKFPNLQTHKCELCGSQFNTIRDFKRHNKSEHPDGIYKLDGKSYTCPICRIKFESSYNLSTHLNEHLPSKMEKQICEICGANFDDRTNLLVHIRRHTNTKNYICSICNRGFVTSTELKSHVVVHSNEQPYVCEICGYRFKYSNRLGAHRLIHGEPRFKCNDCDKQFFFKRHLTEHERVHAPEDVPEVRIKCDVCNSLFRNKGSLSRHKRKIHKTYKIHNTQY